MNYDFDMAQKWAKQYRERIVKDLLRTVETHGEKMEKHAQTNHLYKNRTGALTESIQHSVDYAKNESITLTFAIIPDLVITATGWNYGWCQNDGTLSQYRQGKISPPATPADRVRRGIRHDDFMGMSWDRHIGRLKMDVEKIFGRVV